jgi:HTH-type transcriptional regulator/antitoxin HigA
VSDFEEKYYPIQKPSLVDVIKLRMAEMNLNQKKNI